MDKTGRGERIEQDNQEPDGWQGDARVTLEQALGYMMRWNIFMQAIGIALRNDSYEEFLDALMWLEAERSEP